MKAKEKTKRRARVNVKLVPGISQGQANIILSDTPGLRSIVQLFPDEADAEMLSMYLLEIDPEQLDAALSQLRKNPKLESAHGTAPRKLIW